MFTCIKCSTTFNDGAQCSVCNNYYDFSCAKITEVGFRKLGPDRKAQWRCPDCKNVPNPRTELVGDDTNNKFDTIIAELRDVKFQLATLPTLISDIKVIKDDLVSMKQSLNFTSSQLDDHSARLKQAETKLKSLDNLQLCCDSLNEQLSQVKLELAEKEQWSRINNVEVKGVPVKKNENLFSLVESLGKAVGFDVPKHTINSISRVPTHTGNEKLIVINFTNRYIKEEFVAAARAKKTLKAEEIGFVDNSKFIYINDHLSPANKALLTKTKKVAKEKSYEFVWVKYCKIHLRKNNTSKV